MSLCCCQDTEQEDDKIFFDLHRDTEIPVKDRKQTDLLYFIILAVFFFFLVICVGVAGGQGDIRRSIYEYDGKGNLCGFKNKPIDGIIGSGLDMTQKRFLQTSEFCDGWVCRRVKQCVEKCQDGNNSTSEFSTRCFENTAKNNLESILQVISSDLSKCWKEIIVLCFGSICLSGLLLIVLRMFPEVVIHIMIGTISFATVTWTIFTWVMVGINSSEKKTARNVYLRDDAMMNWLYIALISTAFTLVYGCVLCGIFTSGKMKLLAVLFEEGSNCIKDIPTMLLQPVLNYVITAVFTCFIVLGVICFQTSGKAKTGIDGNVYFIVHDFFQVTSWLSLFALLWLSQFFLACQNLVVAGSVSSWYFTKAKGNLNSPVWRSFCTIVKNHLGSAAFGSLLIAIIKALRILAKMAEKSYRNLAAAILCLIVRCLLACIESILRIINKTAYVMIALFGEPFCSSARKAFACIASDNSQVALIIGTGSFLIAAIEIIITASITITGLALFMNNEQVENVWIPACILCLLAYLCCHCFFSVYEMAINTLTLCFCVDHQMNDGLEKPYYMNKKFEILFNVGDTGGDQKMFVIT